MRGRLLAGTCLLLVGCGGDNHANPIRDAMADVPSGHEGRATAVAFRFPTRGNRVTLFRLPDLEEVAWRFEAGPAATAQIIGFAGDEDLAYSLTAKRQLVALDLTSGRARVVDSSVAVARIGPSGTPFVVHGDGSVARIERRSAVALNDSLPAVPSSLWIGVRDRLVALMNPRSGAKAESRHLITLTAGQAPVSQPLPDGPLAVAAWGDVAAVATDSGLVVLDPSGAASALFVAVRDGAKLVDFSPSAHRIYLVTRHDTLVGLGRFDLEEVGRMPLPGRATQLREGLLGRLLLVKPAGDSAWVVDVTDWRLVGTSATQWDADLPAVAPDGSLIVRRGRNVLALRTDSLTTLGETHDTDGDRWLLAAWDPRRPALELSNDSTPAPTSTPQPPGQLIYVQVSSTSNEAWAADLVQNLQRAGMQATVLPPDLPDDPYRVVLGPYPTREAAEEIRHRLQMPSWILIRDTTQTAR